MLPQGFVLSLVPINASITSDQKYRKNITISHQLRKDLHHTDDLLRIQNVLKKKCETFYESKLRVMKLPSLKVLMDRLDYHLPKTIGR